MLIQQTEFPVRPVRARGESLVGYIHRFYYDNVHEIPITLRQALRDYYSGQNRDYAFKVINKAVGPHRQRDCRLSDNERIDVKLFGEYRPAGKCLRYNPIRYCPTCLNEQGFHAELWTLAQVEACPYHRCVLLKRCSMCDRPLTWGTLRTGWLCPCGAALKDGVSMVAADWQITLATVLIQAADMEKPCPDNGQLETLALSDHDHYEIHHVYQFLARIEHLLRELRSRISYSLIYREPFSMNRSVQADPEIWAVRFLTTSRETRAIRFRRLLKWNFRHQQTVLVRCCTQSPLALVTNALGHLPTNPFAKTFASQVENLLLAYQVGIEHLAGVYFHPRLPQNHHQQYLSTLALWWHGLASRLIVLEPEYQFGKAYRQLTGRSSLDRVIDVLNMLFDAALNGRTFECYLKLAKRWSIPAPLQRKGETHEILAVLVSYLSDLQASELSFLHCLLEDAAYA